MNYLLCMITSVFISTSIMFYVLKVVIKKILVIIKEDNNLCIEHTRNMCEITINGILEILKKRGVLDKDTKPFSFDKD